jgi:Lysyl oxidase
MKTRLRLAIAVMAASLLVPGVALPVAAGESADLLPDLEMAPIFGLQLTTKNGRKRVRFGTIVNNVGDGPMEVIAKSRSGREMRRISQRFYRPDGTSYGIRKPSSAFYAGDGHDHWHIERFIDVALTPLPGTVSEPRYLRKIGFCLVDLLRNPNWAPEDIADGTYFSCGSSGSQRVRMGISVGWGDVYAPDTAFQTIDVTQVPAGSYQICATVNPHGIWTEKGTNYANNSYWMHMELDPANNELMVTNSGNTPCS